MSSGCAGSGASWTCTGSQRGGTIRPPLSTSQFIWEPTPDYVENARVTAFMREHEIADWQELHRRSVEDIGWFWDAVVKHLGIDFFEPYSQVVDESRGPQWSTWFGGGTVNLTHNCVDRHAAGERALATAVSWESEDGEVRTVTYAELSAEVNRLANALLAAGIKQGDAVGVYLPMSPRW